MPVNAVVSIGLFAASNALLHIQNRHLRKKNAKLSAVVLAEAEMLQYYADLLDRHEVQPTAFDIIAIEAIKDKIPS